MDELGIQRCLRQLSDAGIEVAQHGCDDLASAMLLVMQGTELARRIASINESVLDGIARADLEKLEDTVANADGLKYSSTDILRAKTIIRTNKAVFAQLRSALVNNGITTEDWAHEALDVTDLKDAISRASHLELLSSTLKTLVAEGTLVLQIRQAVRAGAWEILRGILVTSQHTDLGSAEAVIAARKLEYYDSVQHCIKQLQHATLQRSREDLHSALERAQLLGIVETGKYALPGSIQAVYEARSISSRLELLQMHLQEAMISPIDKAKVSAALMQAAELNYHGKEVQEAEEALNRATESEAALQAALLNGYQEEWDAATIDTHHLDQAITAAQSFKILSKEGSLLLEKAKFTLILRLCQQGDGVPDWARIERVVHEASVHNVRSAEFDLAREQLTYRSKVLKCEKDLMDAISSANQSSLHAALAQAAQLSIMTAAPHSVSDSAVETVRHAQSVCKRLKDIDIQLTVASVQGDVSKLERALAEASQLNYQPEASHAAREQCDKAKKTQQELEAAMSRGAATSWELDRIDVAKLEVKALNDALGAAERSDASSFELRQLVEKAHVVRDLREAIQEFKWERIEKALVDAARIGLDTPETRRTQEVLDLRKLASTNIKRVLDRGIVLDWQHALINVEGLEKAIQQAEQLDWTGSDGELLLLEAKLTRDIRVGLKTGDWEAVSAAVVDAEHRSISNPEIVAALDKLAYRESVIRCAKDLELGTAHRDFQQLSAALRQATSLEMVPSAQHWQTGMADVVSVVTKAREMHRRMESILKSLKKALSAVDVARMVAALSEAAELDINSSEVCEARVFVSAINSAHDALKVALAKGHQVGWDSSTIETDELTQAIGRAQALATNSKEGAQLLLKAQTILALRLALKASDWATVEKVLEGSARDHISSTELHAVRDKVLFIAHVEKCELHLHEALHEMKRETLELALENLYFLRTTTSDWSRACPESALDTMSVAETLLRRITDIEHQAMSGLRLMDCSLMDEAVSTAKLFGYSSEVIMSAAQVCNDLTMAHQNIRQAIELRPSQDGEGGNVENSTHKLHTALLDEAAVRGKVRAVRFIRHTAGSSCLTGDERGSNRQTW
jgi:hypothetical protein